MRYAVLEPITVKKQGQEIELQSGQVITLPENKAIKLIEAGKINPIPETLDNLSPEQREAYEERAGIMQYDGGLSKEEAEKEARCLYCMLTPGQRVLCEVKNPCPKTGETIYG